MGVSLDEKVIWVQNVEGMKRLIRDEKKAKHKMSLKVSKTPLSRSQRIYDIILTWSKGANPVGARNLCTARCLAPGFAATKTMRRATEMDFASSRITSTHLLKKSKQLS